MRKVAAYILLVLMSLVLTGTIGYTYYIPDYSSELESYGIDVPKDDLANSKNIVSYTTVVDELSIERSITGEPHVIISINDGSTGRISIPGAPALPYKTYMYIANGYIDERDIKVNVKISSYRVIELKDPVIPAPQPIFYSPVEQSIVYKVDDKIYSTDHFYPGRIVDVQVFHGLNGRSVISLKVFPIQYNPVENKLILVEKAYVEVGYSISKEYTFSENNVLILTSKPLVNATNALKGLYTSLGYNASIVTVEAIYSNYTEAENITMYPGFYNPTVVGGYDPVYEMLKQVYNWSLALRIISFLRKTFGNYSHLIIVGDAKTVPPSFYMQSPMMDPYNAWIPTDLFYASPDYDLLPDIYVGRIPFSDPEAISYIVEKISKWYNSEARTSNKLYMSGGYPFGLPLMFGETALSTATLYGWTNAFNTTLMLRTNNNYDRMHVLDILSGSKNAFWYFALSHGTGNALADLLIQMSEKYPLRLFEILASTDDLLAMKESNNVPIVSSVACMNAFWDEALIPPEPFIRASPPSFGEAILLSPAGGIAYIGSARVATELGIQMYIIGGIATADFYGAARLHLDILSAYTELSIMKNVTSLGEIIGYGIAKYLNDVYGVAGSLGPYMLLAFSEIMKLTLLGDPALKIELPSQPTLDKGVKAVSLPKPDVAIKADALFYYTIGEVYIYRPYTEVKASVYGYDGEYYRLTYKIVSTPYTLYGYTLLAKDTISLENGMGSYTIEYNKVFSGKILVKIGCEGWGEIRVLTASLGLSITPSKTIAGSNIVIEGFGLDVLGPYSSIDVVVAGRVITSLEVPVTGYLNWTMALPYLAPGEYPIWFEAKSWYLPPEIAESLRSILSSRVFVYKVAKIDIALSIPEILEPESELKIIVMTLVEGKPVKVNNIEAYILTPEGEVLEPSISQYTSKELGLVEGTYEISVNASKTGVYTLIVKAYYEDKTMVAQGYRMISFSISKDIYTGMTLIRTDIEKLKSYIKTENEFIKNSLEDLANNLVTLNASLDKSLSKILEEVVNSRTTLVDEVQGVNKALSTISSGVSELESSLENVNSNVNEIAVRLGSLEEALTALGKSVDSAKQEILSQLQGTKEDIVSKVNEVGSQVSGQYNTLTIVDAITLVIALAIAFMLFKRK